MLPIFPVIYTSIHDFRNLSSSQPIAAIHGAVLALVASVLSAPYDMPRYVMFNPCTSTFGSFKYGSFNVFMNAAFLFVLFQCFMLCSILDTINILK